MPLALTVVILVTVVTVILAVVGILIDKSAERHEHKETDYAERHERQGVR